MTLDLGIVTGSLSPDAGGLFQSVRLPARVLTGRGASVSVYGLHDDRFQDAKAQWHGVSATTFPVRGPHRLGFSPGMLKGVLAGRHDVLHLHGIWFFPSYVVDAWRRRTGGPTIISPRGMLDPWAVKSSSAKKRIASLLYEDRNLAGAAAIHALNDREAAAIRSYGLVNPIAVIPNGVGLPDATSRPSAPGWMTGDDRRVLLFLGRIHPKKGLRELIDAWRILRDTAPVIARGWRLAIAGWDDGGHLAELKARVVQAGMGDDIAFTGPLHGEAKAAALAHCAAFILPSHSEGMPMSVLEAWSYARPVFMTDACNLPNGFAAGAAVRVETAPDALAACLAEHIECADDLERMGAAGRELVKLNYTWDRVVDDMLELYDWTLGRVKRPPFVQ